MRTEAVFESGCCSVCGKEAAPVLRFYRRAPDAFVCPHCGQSVHRFDNEARRLDRLLAGTLSVATVLTFAGLWLS